MAIFLDKSASDPALNSKLWGTEINPESFYRVYGDKGQLGMDIYKQILREGAIRGSGGFSGHAYFSRGAPQGIYLQNNPSLMRELLHWPESQVGNNNFFVEATPRFNPYTNPLYGNSVPEIAIGGATNPWPVAGESVSNGGYRTLDPREGTRFIDRINPKNQRHLRVGQAYTTGWQSALKGFEGGAPNWDWKFDYTKPFTETSVKQHAKNLKHIGKTVLAQPETQAALKGAGKTVKVTAGTAGLLAYLKGIAEDAPKTVLEWGVPFTPMKMGVGPTLPLGKGSDMQSRGRYVYTDKGPVWIPNEQ